jgi:putative transposase
LVIVAAARVVLSCDDHSSGVDKRPLVDVLGQAEDRQGCEPPRPDHHPAPDKRASPSTTTAEASPQQGRGLVEGASTALQLLHVELKAGISMLAFRRPKSYLSQEQPRIAGVFHQPTARLHQPLLQAGQGPIVDPPWSHQPLPQVPQVIGNHTQPQAYLVRSEPMATEPRHLLGGVEETMSSIPIERPTPTPEQPQGICLDKGDDCDDVRELLATCGFTAHIRARGEEDHAITHATGYKARRWVVERTHRWMNRFRRWLIRWDKQVRNYRAFLHLARAYITYGQSGLLG